MSAAKINRSTETNAETTVAAGLDMALTIIATNGNYPLRTERRTDGALINNPPYFKQTLSTYANTKYVCGTEQGRGTKGRTEAI